MATTHIMHLTEQPFLAVASGKKDIELRLNDPKRQSVRIGDRITFVRQDDSSRSLTVHVVGLLRYANFSDLVNDFPLERMAPYRRNKVQLIAACDEVYPHAKQVEFGVLGIRITKI